MFAMLLPAHVIGGMEIHSLDLAKGLAAKGHDVHVITSKHPGGLKEEDVDGAKIHYVDSPPTSKRPLGKAAYKKLIELNAQKKFDVIHSQSFSAYEYVADGLRESMNVPLVATLHGTPIGEIKSNLNQGLTTMLLPKLLFQTFNYFFRFRKFVPRCDAVIAISKELNEKIPKEFKIMPEKVKTVYNGVDTDLFSPGESNLKKEYSGKIVLSACVLHRQKGVQYLIEAFKQVSESIADARLLIVGTGGFKDALVELTEKLGLSDKVIFCGRVQNEKLREYYRLCNVFAIPTVRVEGLPLIELEAMSCAKPVVASKIGGIPTVIIDGENGLLTEPSDVAGLAKAIKKCLVDKEYARQLGLNARQRIVDGFSKKHMVEGTLKVYENVLKEGD